jgi:hypothetical protein
MQRIGTWVRVPLAGELCPVKPFCQLVRIGIDIRPAGTRNTMHRHSAHRFPTLHRPLVAAKKRADLFPRIETLVSSRAWFCRSHILICPELSSAANCAGSVALVNDTPDRGVWLEPSFTTPDWSGPRCVAAQPGRYPLATAARADPPAQVAPLTANRQLAAVSPSLPRRAKLRPAWAISCSGQRVLPKNRTLGHLVRPERLPRKEQCLALLAFPPQFGGRGTQGAGSASSGLHTPIRKYWGGTETCAMLTLRLPDSIFL